MDLLATNVTIRYFYFIFAIIFGWLFLQVLFENLSYSYATLPVLGMIFIWSSGAALIFKIIKRAELFLSQHPKVIALAILGIASCIQLYFAYELELQTAWDIEAVYKGAVTLAQNDNLGRFTQYFNVYPHNLGPTTFLSWIFSLFPQQDTHGYYWLGAIYNIFAINCTFFLVFLICCELKNTRSAFFALLLCLTCIPLYFYVPIFYSDTLSLPFSALIYYLYLMLLKSDARSTRIALAFSLGLACTLGSMMKFTVLIIAIAILIELISRQKIKQLSLYIFISALTFYGTSQLYSNYLYKNIIDKNQVSQQHYPYTHWVMMGLEGNGAYNANDDGFTRSFGTSDAKTAANLSVIKQRLQNYGAANYLSFLNKKQQHNFGSGHYGIHYLLDDSPLRRSWLHDYALEDGKHFSLFCIVTQGYHVFLFVLIILGALYDATQNNQKPTQQLTIRLSIFGIFLFLLLWEANSRLVLHFMPMFILGAAIKYEEVFNFFSTQKTYAANQLKSLNNTITNEY